MSPALTTQNHAENSNTLLAESVRQRIRSGELTGHTSGLADQHVQGNVVILPRRLATDFLGFCQKNPKPCPLLAMSRPGEFLLPTLGADVDIRTDVPRYRVWRNGELVDQPTDEEKSTFDLATPGEKR